jgi:hypothetical protein
VQLAAMRNPSAYAMAIAAACSTASLWYTTGLRSEIWRADEEAKTREATLLRSISDSETKLSTAMDEVIRLNRLLLRQSGVANCPPCAAAGCADGEGGGPSCLTTAEGYGTDDGFFTLGMKLWKIDPVTRKLDLPAAVKRVWVDVGTHAKAGVTRPFLNTEEDLFIIGFEPNRYQVAAACIAQTHVLVYGMSAPPAYGLADPWL